VIGLGSVVSFVATIATFMGVVWVLVVRRHPSRRR
jgi:hypothetical protein